MSVTMEYNIRRHYETKHQAGQVAYCTRTCMDMTQRSQKVEEMKIHLVSQQNMFKKATSQSEAAACKG